MVPMDVVILVYTMIIKFIKKNFMGKRFLLCLKENYMCSLIANLEILGGTLISEQVCLLLEGDFCHVLFNTVIWDIYSTKQTSIFPWLVAIHTKS